VQISSTIQRRRRRPRTLAVSIDEPYRSGMRREALLALSRMP
jgi:hypothetical protein